jgi:nitrate/TMAO reductase-like tetraheme cytochrome c subunit
MSLGRGFLSLKILALILVVGTALAVSFVSLGGDALLSDLAKKVLPKKTANSVTVPAETPDGTSASEKGDAVASDIRGRAGCLVCHSDKNAVGVIGGKTRSIFVDEALFQDSPHKNLSCLSCHLDFSYSHPVEVADYKKIAGLACSKCHSHNKQAIDYRASVHGRLALSGDPKGGATCSDCHGAHDIIGLKDSKANKLQIRSSAKEVCGNCHADFYKAYNDYYHGRAYKRGASDAPACWDCHDYHTILPAKEGNSSVSKINLAKTCGRCHEDSSKRFTEYARLIHGRKAVEEKNLVLRYKILAVEWAGKLTKPVSGISGNWFSRNLGSYLERVRSWFFPESLRPKQD